MSANNHLTRESILGSADLPTEEMEVPRWGGTIVVKAVPAGHPRYVQYWAGRHDEKLSDDEKQVRRFVGAAIMAAHAHEGEDEDGNPVAGPRLFKFSDADELRAKHYNSVIQVANRGLALAGNTEAEDRGMTINALLRVGSYAQAHDWPEEQQDRIAALIEYVAAEAGMTPDTDDDESDDEAAPLDEAAPED